MLQFILGRASSGKTYTITQKIAECLSQGESPVLLVPEQFLQSGDGSTNQEQSGDVL